MRLGIFGGSFDPVHKGHLVLADCCATQAALDKVWFVPTAHQPLKPQGPVANDEDRLAMLSLATADDARFIVSDIELDRGGVSYTVDTLREICVQQPDAKLYFLMGADSLTDLPQWHKPAEICQLSTPLVVCRAGQPAPDFGVLEGLVSPQRRKEIEESLVEMPETPISSSEIRKLIAANGQWSDLVPPTVSEYIGSKQLYGSGS